MKIKDIFGGIRLTEIKTEIDSGEMTKIDVQPVTSMNAKTMSRKQMEEYDLYLVVDKKIFGFNIGGSFLVTGMKYKPDGGLMVKVPKQQRASGEIYIPSNRAGAKFILSKGPDSGPSIPVDTHVAITLFNRGINEGKENDKLINKKDLSESKMSELHAVLPKSWKNPKIYYATKSTIGTEAALVIVQHDDNKFNVITKLPNKDGWEVNYTPISDPEEFIKVTNKTRNLLANMPKDEKEELLSILRKS